MILQAQCTGFHVHWVHLSKSVLNIDYFSDMWYNIIIDF